MHDAVTTMLKRYRLATQDEYVHALKEIMQEIALLGLWRAKFFEHAAFYGGTALRILYGLDRFSEDMDFSLLTKNNAFKLVNYLRAMRDELEAFGFSVVVNQKKRTRQSSIDSAFIKANTTVNFLEIKAPPDVVRHVASNHVLKIKIEVDTAPPGDFLTEAKYVLQPIPFAVITYQQPDLFAGKLHALLCRRWQNRVKGRDWYDLVWYVGNKIPLRLKHLEARLRDSGHWQGRAGFERSDLIAWMQATIDKLDVAATRRDVEPFVRDTAALEVWSREFFVAILERLEVC